MSSLIKSSSQNKSSSQINPTLQSSSSLSPLTILQTQFGYSAFRDPQQAIIESVIEGRDTTVIMPTGGGKSLCYQIPAIALEGTGIVVSPLIALMDDQVTALKQNGVRAAYLNSTMNMTQVQEVEQMLLQQQLDLLYVAPERLMMDRFINLLSRTRIALFAIDEAHCVSQWGHDFRPEYIQLSALAELFPNVPRIALTATADDTTRKEIIDKLSLDHSNAFICGFDRPNIQYRVQQGSKNAKQALLDFIQQEHPDDAGIVYCLSRKKVEQIADWLTSKGLTALPYHAGLSSDMRRQHQQRFLQQEGVIIVATIAFGMGIDKPDVRFVAHLNLPKSIEAYYQETGRAGRDGLPATAWMSYGLNDVITLRQMLETSDAPEQHKRVERHKLDAVLGFAEITDCRRQSLLGYFGEALAEPCGNCDTCLTPVETWNATEVAQKALSTVYRTGQRFGVNHLIDVLLGKENVKVKNFKHDELSVYGIGQELDVSQWRSVFRQLISRNLLKVDLEGYGGVQLTEACRPVLKGESELYLRKDVTAVSQKKKARGRPEQIKQSDFNLWEALREARMTVAKDNKLAPYMVFNDATLMAMVESKPTSLSQMAMISGVGERKLELYGELFLQVIADNAESTRPTAEESLKLFQQDKTVAEIAHQRGLAESTVFSHLATAIQQGQLLIDDILDINDLDLNLVHQLFLEQEGDKVRMKPVFEALDGKFSYGELQCIKAHFLLE